ncbi:MAG: hypothetical protein Q4E35_01255 [Eubacteriales bacterium]|nr:hypothetical protein [Eubacteriales bacterium]
MNIIQRFNNGAILWKIGYPTEEQRAVIHKYKLIFVMRPQRGWLGYVDDASDIEKLA